MANTDRQTGPVGYEGYDAYGVYRPVSGYADGAEGTDGRDNNIRFGRDRYGSRQSAAIETVDAAETGRGFTGGADGAGTDAAVAGATGRGGVRKKLGINARTVPAYFVRLILAAAVSFSIVYAVTETAGIHTDPLTILLLCSLTLVGLSLFFWNVFVGNGLILASLAVFGIWLFRLHRLDRLDDYRIIASYHTRRFAYWALNFFYTGSPRNVRYETLLFALVLGFVCLVVYFITIKRYNFALIFTFGFATFCTQWCYGFYAGHLPFFVFVAAAVIGYIWHIYHKNLRLYGGASALFTPLHFLKAIAPLFLCLLFCVAFVPAPASPIRMQWLYDVVNDVSMRFYDRFYFYRVDNFALNTTGFSKGESFLSGPVRLNNTQVLTVVTQDPTLYLKGNGKEIYTGNSWKNPPYEAESSPQPVDGTPTGTDDSRYGQDAGDRETAPADLVFSSEWGIRMSGAADDDTDDLRTSGSSSTSAAAPITDDSSVSPAPAVSVSPQENPAAPDQTAAVSAPSEASSATSPDSPVQPSASGRPPELEEAMREPSPDATAPPRPAVAKIRRVSPTPTPQPVSGLEPERDITDLDAPELTDVDEMARAIERMDADTSAQLPGPLYADGDTEVTMDVDEYALNHRLLLFRLLAGGPDDAPAWPGITPDTLENSDSRMLDGDQERTLVRYDRMKTFSLFTASKLSKLENMNMDVGEIYEGGGALSIENIMAQGFIYEFEYFPEDRNSGADFLLQNSYQGLYRDMLGDYGDIGILYYPDGQAGRDGTASDALIRRSRRRREPEVLWIGDYIERRQLSELADRADEIRERYTALPDGLPARVRRLAERLTADALTDYEMALALERFLYTNYGYSLDVGYLPSGEDFVDNFLFELSEGYCTHFASALAVLARCVGLPSRYVEGYTLPGEINEEGVYYVTNAEAHAWVEIYFEGYGWSRFEPTATYQDRIIRYTGAGVTGEVGAGGAGGEYYDEYMDEMMYDQYGYSGEIDLAALNAANRRAAMISNMVRIGLTAFAVLLLAGVLIFGRWRTNRRFAAFSAEPGKAVGSMYGHYIKILRYMKCGISSGETLAQFAARVDSTFRFGDTGFASALEPLEKLVYSEHEITEADRQKVSDFYPKLLLAYSLRKSKLSYVFMKDIIAAI